MAIVDEGNTVLVQVLPSWIYTGRIRSIVIDPLVPELSYAVVDQCVWVERCSNHVDLISEENPEAHQGLRCHLFPDGKKIALTKITSADHMERLIGKSVR